MLSLLPVISKRNCQSPVKKFLQLPGVETIFGLNLNDISEIHFEHHCLYATCCILSHIWFSSSLLRTKNKKTKKKSFELLNYQKKRQIPTV